MSDWSYRYDKPRAEVHRERYGDVDLPIRRGAYGTMSGTTSYVLWSNKQLQIPWNWASNSMKTSKTIRWGKDTTITGAKILLSVLPYGDYCKARLKLNGEEVWYDSWGMLATDGRQYNVDVVGFLANGINGFEFIGEKEFGNFLYRDFTVTATLVLTYEGKDPDVGDPMEDYLTYAIAGGAALSGVYLIGKYIESKRE